MACWSASLRARDRPAPSRPAARPRPRRSGTQLPRAVSPASRSRKVRSSSSTAEGCELEQRARTASPEDRATARRRGARRGRPATWSSRHSISVTKPSVPSAPMTGRARRRRRSKAVERVARGVLPGVGEATRDRAGRRARIAGAASSARSDGLRSSQSAGSPRRSVYRFSVRGHQARAPRPSGARCRSGPSSAPAALVETMPPSVAQRPLEGSGGSRRPCGGRRRR